MDKKREITRRLGEGSIRGVELSLRFRVECEGRKERGRDQSREGENEEKNIILKVHALCHDLQARWPYNDAGTTSLNQDYRRQTGTYGHFA